MTTRDKGITLVYNAPFIDVRTPLYGYKGDGSTDDTAALVLADADAAAQKKTLYITGTPLISATFIPTCSCIEFAGASGGGNQTSYLIKKSTMSTAGLKITVKDFTMIGGGVKVQSGATGDGIVIAANGVKLLNNPIAIAYSSATASGNGFRVGLDAGPSNCNSWVIENGYAANWSGKGLYVHDKPGYAPDANGGHALNFIAQNNAQDGVCEGNASLNTYTNVVSEGNGTWGLTIGGSYSTVVGGDRESNSVGNLQIALGATHTTLVGVNPAEVGDFSNATKSSINTKRLERYVAVQGQWTPTLKGTSTPGVQTYGTQSGWWFRDGDYILLEGVITLTAKDAATAGTLQIGGLPFVIPSSVTSGVFGFAIARWGNFTLDAGYTQLTLSIGPNSSSIDLVECGSTKTSTPLPAANASATSQIWFSGRIPIATF